MSKIEQTPQKSNFLPENIFNFPALKQFIQTCVQEESNKQTSQKEVKEESDDDWIGTEELIQITGLTQQNVYQKSFYDSFEYPVYKSGRKLRFKRSEVIAAMKKKIQNYEMEAIVQAKAENYLINGKKQE